MEEKTRQKRGGSGVEDSKNVMKYGKCIIKRKKGQDGFMILWSCGCKGGRSHLRSSSSQ